jgi:hypothetical protein
MRVLLLLIRTTPLLWLEAGRTLLLVMVAGETIKLVGLAFGLRLLRLSTPVVGAMLLLWLFDDEWFDSATVMITPPEPVLFAAISLDSVTFSGGETGGEIGIETGSEIGAEIGSEDTGNEKGVEAENEKGAEIGNETGAETGNETGKETGTDIGIGNGAETGTATGTEVPDVDPPPPVKDPVGVKTTTGMEWVVGLPPPEELLLSFLDVSVTVAVPIVSDCAMSWIVHPATYGSDPASPLHLVVPMKKGRVSTSLPSQKLKQVVADWMSSALDGSLLLREQHYIVAVRSCIFFVVVAEAGRHRSTYAAKAAIKELHSPALMRCRQRLEEASAMKTIHRKTRLVQSSRCAL